ncbi:choice-of-anchor I family protein [Olleya sp. HaHaR_3_96]|uniref:choice-of-anchor I family protein n=1 Tax=Olleya sp. HaHaR_3_96 TaxID=2745560 RepID=UPI001C4F053D|nr:choice-of-anchor I family protein [Olleya sp. HaHaR_3_96]QXP61337.1 choice-of-anchor I family protein [Olleya sp. HaHaR_3_96]
MKHLKKSVLLFSTLLFLHCADDDDNTVDLPTVNTAVNFTYKTTITVGGEAAAEISAYDKITKKLFVTNAESNEISIYNLLDLESPIQEPAISLSAFGSPNSVAVFDGKLAVAVEAPIKQNVGQIRVYNTSDSSLYNQYTVGALPDMVTFSKDGNFILSANEGEPNADYTDDPMGTVSIIDLNTDTVTTLDFTSFNSQEAALEADHFRVTGLNADLAKDVEPEYITISEDSQTAWVSLQENNGIAKINLLTKTIEAILPLGYKDHMLPQNSLDVSNEDGVTELKNWPVRGLYQPDAIVSVRINGTDYVISANEGDAREYEGTPGYTDIDRVKDLTLDATMFPAVEDYQNEVNLGRLNVMLSEGDIDNDGDFDYLYSYGARSFTIWNGNGGLVYDSGNSIATETLTATPDTFNDEDKRSDDKGAEPESVDVLNIGDQRYILFVGLERTDQVMVYDISNPNAPVFLSILSHSGDEAPEGLLAIPAIDSPTGKDLLIVSNEDSGTVSFYENQQ